MKQLNKLLLATSMIVLSQPALSGSNWSDPGSWGNPGSWGGNQPMMGNPMMGMGAQRMMGSGMSGRLDRMEQLLLSIDSSLKQLVELERRKQHTQR